MSLNTYRKHRTSMLTFSFFLLRVLALGPFLRLPEDGVPEDVVWVVLEGNSSGRVPLGVLFPEALDSVCPQLQGLSFPKLHDQNIRCKNMVKLTAIRVVNKRNGYLTPIINLPWEHPTILHICKNQCKKKLYEINNNFNNMLMAGIY